MDKQLTHYEVENFTTTKKIIVVGENIRTPENVGMIFRVSEAFGVKKVIFMGESPDLDSRKVLRTARNTLKELTIILSETPENTIFKLKKKGYTLLGLEITKKSSLLKDFNFNAHNKIALFIGAERFGIAETTLNQLDHILHFDLFGNNSSVNVVNALTVGLYEVTR
jgi:tRNA G18 (ribose-2'-O)-methylase SpoU